MKLWLGKNRRSVKEDKMDTLLQTIEYEANLSDDYFFADMDVDVLFDEEFDDELEIEDDWEMEF
jgi:hypothetical protein